MKKAQAVMALILFATVLGLTAGLASASMAASWAGVPASGHGQAATVTDIVSSAHSKLTAPLVAVDPASVKGKLSGHGAAAVKPKASPKAHASITPTKTRRSIDAHHARVSRVSPSAKPTARGGVRHMIMRDDLRDQSYKIPRATPGNIPGITAKPMIGMKGPLKVKHMLAMPAATKKPVPSGSPTPVPGGYTPRFPGEPGAGKTLVVLAVPRRTIASQPAQKVAVPYASKVMSQRGTAGQCLCVPLSSELRYAGRGPGLVNGQKVERPASAPAPFTRPLAAAPKR